MTSLAHYAARITTGDEPPLALLRELLGVTPAAPVCVYDRAVLAPAEDEDAQTVAHYVAHTVGSLAADPEHYTLSAAAAAQPANDTVPMLLARAPHTVHLLEAALPLVPAAVLNRTFASILTVACGTRNVDAVACIMRGGARFTTHAARLYYATDDAASIGTLFKATPISDADFTKRLLVDAVQHGAYACAAVYLGALDSMFSIAALKLPTWEQFCALPDVNRRRALIRLWRMLCDKHALVGDGLSYVTVDETYECMCVVADDVERLQMFSHAIKQDKSFSAIDANVALVCGRGMTLPRLIAQHDSIVVLKRLSRDGALLTVTLAARMLEDGVPHDALRVVRWLLHDAFPQLCVSLPFMRARDDAARSLVSTACSDAMRALLLAAADGDAVVARITQARREALRHTGKKRKKTT